MVILLQTSIADYRNQFCELLSLRLGQDFKIYLGEEYFYPSVKSSPEVIHQKNSRLVKNHFFLKRQVLLQSLPLFHLLKADVVVFELNPRIISNWPVLLLRKLLKKKNVGWGHLWAREGVGAKTEPVRHLMRSLCNGLLFYTNAQKAEFISVYGSTNWELNVAPNALYSKENIISAESKGKNILYVGRLVKDKKVDFLIKCYLKAIQDKAIPGDTLLEIVGAGPELDALRELVPDQFKTLIIFHGHVAGLDKLLPLYERSLLTVSPGYLGLSVTQSFAFGRPMLISKHEPHSPEIEAVIEGDNAFFYETDSIDSFIMNLKFFYDDSDWSERNSAISAFCSENYSVESMVDGFVEAVSYE